jgi:LPS export ABC transporter protein LptC
MFLFLSCGNSKEEIKLVLNQDDGPTEVSEGVTMLFTDKGLAKMKLESPLMHRYELDEGAEMKMECPIGMKVTFYDSIGNEESNLTAKYGVLFSKNEYILVKDSVVFLNFKEEKLTTEVLHIDFKKDSVYTNQKVTVSSPKGTITGVGLSSNANFTKYRVHNINNGEYEIEEKELNNTENE